MFSGVFKGILCLIIIICCGAMGLFKSQTYSRRVAELSDARDVLRMLRTEISYMKDPLPVIFERIGNSRDSTASAILKDCSSFMKNNRDMESSWYSAMESATESSCLTDTDKAILSDLGTQLGRSNTNGQADLLKMTDEKLLLQLEEAEHHKRSKGKMYAGLGFSIGIVIAILLV